MRILSFYCSKSSNNGSTSKPLAEMLIDSIIVGGIVFFSTWSGKAQLDELLYALKGFGLAFFTQLAYYKGIRRGKSYGLA